MPTPKPAGGADAHRDGDGGAPSDEDDDDDVVPPATGGGGGSGGDGGIGDSTGRPPGGGGMGSSLGGSLPSTRTLAIGLGLVVAAGLAYHYMNNRTAADAMNRSTDQQERRDGGEGEGEEGDPEMPDITQDPNDPLAADHEAGHFIFNGWGSN